jgi:hypothetical protein
MLIAKKRRRSRKTAAVLICGVLSAPQAREFAL